MNSQRKSSSNRTRRPRRQERRGRNRNSQNSKPQKKVGFFGKILAFFSGGDTPSTSTSEKKQSTSSPRKTASKRSGERRERTARKPKQIEVTSPRVYVGNLSFDATESDLADLFNGIGIVNSAEIVFNRHTHRSKGFGFVQMQTIDEAKRAVEKLHDQDYMGRKLVVSGAKALDERKPSRSSDDSSVNGKSTEEPEPVAAEAEETSAPQAEQ
ncbi:MAG: RNA recognition motif domain-containing protein [Chthoniobacterales bacterium]